LILPHMLGLVSISLLSKHVFIVFTYIYIKEIGGEDAEFYFFLLIALQILYVFLLDISIHCALIDYVYI